LAIFVWTKIVPFKKKAMRKIFTTLLLLVILSRIGFAQFNEDFKKKYSAAEAFFAVGNYSDALQNYLKLNELAPNNPNLSYKIGVCLVNMAGRRAEAIPYFMIAKRFISKKYKGNYKEKRAPDKTLYWAGKAYLSDYKIDMAISSFTKYKEFLKKDSTKIKMVDLLLSNCNNAKYLMKTPINIKLENLGASVNSAYSDYSPVISRDMRTLIFTSRREGTTGDNKTISGKFFEDIYIVRQNPSSQAWENLQKISPNINTEGHEASDYLSNDNKELYIYKADEGNGDLFISKFVNDEWQKPEEIKGDVNTDSVENHACLSPDEKKMFFVSNRKGGFGGKDIYMATKDEKGEWGNVVNLGNVINTPYDDDVPYVIGNSQGYLTLYFSSQGHESMGGFDIFTSTSSGDNVWTPPQNLGYPINTTDDDAFFIPTLDKRHAYYVTALKDGYGDQDLYYLTMLDVPEEKLDLTTIIPSTNIDTSNANKKITNPVTDNNNNNGNNTNTTNNGNNANNTTNVTTNNNNSNNNQGNNTNTNNNVTNNQNQTTNSNAEIYYTVQVGAGDIHRVYFEKVLDVKVITNCKDGMKRYISGKYDTKEEAFTQRQRLIFLGYTDAFVRTITKDGKLDLSAETGIIKPEK